MNIKRVTTVVHNTTDCSRPMLKANMPTAAAKFAKAKENFAALICNLHRNHTATRKRKLPTNKLDSLEAKWLGICLLSRDKWVRSPPRELRSVSVECAFGVCVWRRSRFPAFQILTLFSRTRSSKAERTVVNRWVVGSNPSLSAKNILFSKSGDIIL